MMTIEQIRERLKFMNLKKVSEGANIHSNTLYRVAKDKTPSYEVLIKLSEFLERKDT